MFQQSKDYYTTWVMYANSSQPDFNALKPIDYPNEQQKYFMDWTFQSGGPENSN